MKNLLAVLLLTLSANAYADTADIIWNEPTTRTDGSELLLTEIAGYKLYINSVPYKDPLTNVILIKNTSKTITFIGENIINLTTIDIDGRESPFSPDIVISGKSSPNYPDVTITITIELSDNIN